ncbi:hypothetical protein [Actinoplanes siamensis]|uniref:Amino acid permease-like protein n=1 Tax=Actinoplanes siamensis TaxID=1223317 RepID=A0A919NAC4_9ACTN|nr:hypothetical protein [Actinoplanes siamensis]GIF07406.1 hypothetical protein Asi03nite_49440 [Actinoplanes siamensis]
MTTAFLVLTTVVAFGLIRFADLTALGGTTALLLLCVFTVVNVAVLVLRRDRVPHRHFRAPPAIPVLGAAACAFVASPLSGRAAADYRVAGMLLVVGIVLWAVTYLAHRHVDPARGY